MSLSQAAGLAQSSDEWIIGAVDLATGGSLGVLPVHEDFRAPRLPGRIAFQAFCKPLFFEFPQSGVITRQDLGIS